MSPGTTTINGNYAQNSPGRLQIELASNSSFDKLVVTGNLAISGALLDVLFLPGYVPAAGHSFDILDWGSIQLIGGGWTLSLPAIGGGLMWNQSQLYTAGVLSIVAPVLAGDYNHNGVVDAADYVVWRDNTGTNNPLPNDPIGGTIGSAQYDQWRAHFGQAVGGGSAAAQAVPEPTCVGLTVAAFIVGALVLRSHRQNQRRL